MPFSKFKKYIFGENKGEKVADWVSKLKKKKTPRKSLPRSPSPSKTFFKGKINTPFHRAKKRGTPFVRRRVKGAEMYNEKVAEAYDAGVIAALQDMGLLKEGQFGAPSAPPTPLKAPPPPAPAAKQPSIQIPPTPSPPAGFKGAEISLPGLKKQTAGPAAGVTPGIMKPTLTSAPAKPPPPAVSRVSTPPGGGTAKRFPPPKLPTVASR